MALTNSQLVDIRRHLSVPFAGVPDSRFTAGIRTLLRVGQLEFYMQVLQIEEEAVLTGYPYGVIRIAGNVTAGQTVSAVINSGSPITYNVSAADVAAQNPLLSVASGLTLAINLAGLSQLAASAAVTFRNAPPETTPNVSFVTLVNPTTFTLTASTTGGNLGAVVPPDANGQLYPWPRYAPDVPPGGSAVTYYGYIQICNFLESQIAQADNNLSLTSAGGSSKQAAAVFRKDETAARAKLYDYWRRRMGILLSVGMDPAGREGMASGLGITV